MTSEAFTSVPEPEENRPYVVDSREDYVPERLQTPGATVDPVKDYLRVIGKTPLLDAEQEVELAKRIEAGLLAGKIVAAREKARSSQDLSEEERRLVDRWRGKAAIEQLEWLAEDGAKAKNHMLEANLRLVVSLAKRYTGRGMAFLDLIQEGNGGLIRAVEKFDYTRGFKFSTYATWWIRQAITRSMADQSRTIRIPVHMVEVINKVNRIQRQMLQDLGREPTTEELAKEVSITPEKLLEVQKYGREPVSLDTPLGDGGGRGRGQSDTYLGDLIEDTTMVSPDDAAEFSELRTALDAVLDTLSEREAGVIRMRRGLDDGTPKTLDEIGKVYGVTRERIRQIEAKAMIKLRHPSRSSVLEGFLED